MITEQELKNLGNKIKTIFYRPNNSLFTITIAKVFKENNVGYVVVSNDSLRKNFMSSAQQIYYFGKKNVDFKTFKTTKSAIDYINKLKK